MLLQSINFLSLLNVNKRIFVIVMTFILLTIALAAVSGVVVAGPATSGDVCGACP